MSHFNDVPPSRTSFVNFSRPPKLSYLRTVFLATIPVMLAAFTVLVVRDALSDSDRRLPSATTSESPPMSLHR